MRFQVLTAASMKMRASGIYSRIFLLGYTDVSEVHTTSINRAFHHPDDGGSMHL
jgi:hypothetical protein